MERILFLYAKTNKGIGYVQVNRLNVQRLCVTYLCVNDQDKNYEFVPNLYLLMQGMNEVLGPIYYVFAQHPDPKWKGIAK